MLHCPNDQKDKKKLEICVKQSGWQQQWFEMDEFVKKKKKEISVSASMSWYNVHPQLC